MWQGHPLIPWKENSIQIRNSTLLHEYDQIITDYFKNKIIEVNENEVVTSAHYLPHHAVIKSDREATKIRIRFAVSAKINNKKTFINFKINRHLPVR